MAALGLPAARLESVRQALAALQEVELVLVPQAFLEARLDSARKAWVGMVLAETGEQEIVVLEVLGLHLSFCSLPRTTPPLPLQR